MNFKTIIPLNIFVYFFKHRDTCVKYNSGAALPVFRQMSVWKINANSKRLECHFLLTNKPEEESPNNFLLAC